MPFVYRSPNLQRAAQRGRRMILHHPDWRQLANWDTCAADLIADILHGLHTRVELPSIAPVTLDNGTVVYGMDATLERAKRIFEADFEEETEY